MLYFALEMPQCLTGRRKSSQKKKTQGRRNKLFVKNREEEITYLFPNPIWYRLTHCRPSSALLALLSTPVIRKLLIHLFQPLPTNSNPKYLLSNFDSSFLTRLPILSDSFSSSPVFFFSPPVQLDYTVFFTSMINYTTQVTESA